MRGGGGPLADPTVQVAESSWGMATMHTQFGWGPGVGHEVPTMVGRVRRTRPSGGLYSTQEFVSYARVCPKRFGATVQRAVGFAKLGGQSGSGITGQAQMEWGQGPGAKHPLGTVQLALEGCTHQLCSWVWLGQATQWWVGSFGRALVLGCIVRRSLYHTHWVCAVCCAQWAVPTSQLHNLVQSGPKGGRGVRGLRPQLWAPTISPVLGGSITSPPVGGSITS